jgi:nucleotide-binding universal stress UspA family protein
MTDGTGIIPIQSGRRVLFCTDFSANADHAFEYAIKSATAVPGGHLIILHVIPEPEAQFWKTYVYELEGIDEKAKQDIDAKLADAYLSRVPKGLETTVEIRIGKDYLEILKLAAEREVDLIVLGRQGHTAFGRMFFGNVTERVIRKTACPVLVVPMSPAPGAGQEGAPAWGG